MDNPRSREVDEAVVTRRTGTKTGPERQAAGQGMRAAVFTGSEDVRVETVPVPDPGPGEVRIRLEGCGVCASNLPVWEGRSWFDYPLEPGAPGHEGWGHVDALGEGVTHVAEGDRVAALTYHAYGQHDIAREEVLVKLPAVLDGQPFPGEPLGCAVNVFRRSSIEAGQTVAVVGIGFLGALLTGLATAAGARVIAISRRPYALRVARQYGAAETIRFDTPEGVVERVQEMTGGHGCDRAIEATGKQGPLDVAGRLLRVRGRLVVAGYHQDGKRQVDMQLWNWRGLDVINAHERDEDVYIDGMKKAVELVASGALDPKSLYTHRFPLENLSEALRLVRERPEGFLKALVVF